MTGIKLCPWRALKWQVETKRWLSYFMYCLSKRQTSARSGLLIAHHILVSISLSWTSVTASPQTTKYPAFCLQLVPSPPHLLPQDQQLLSSSSFSALPVLHVPATTAKLAEHLRAAHLSHRREAAAGGYAHCQLHPAKLHLHMSFTEKYYLIWS